MIESSTDHIQRRPTALGVSIAGTGAYTPDQILDNPTLIERFGLDVDPEWIEDRTGIVTRHWMRDGQTTSDMATAAALRICEDAQVRPEELDRIILATISGDYPSPATATVVARKLGARCMAFDLSAACAGFLYGLDLGIASVRCGADKVLVLAADARSRFIDKGDRRAAVLFADAAAGVLLEPSSDGAGFLGVHVGAEGRERMGAWIPAGGARQPTTPETVAAGAHFLQVDSKREIFDLFVGYTREACDAALARAELTLDDVDLFITHQGNARMVELVIDALGIDPARAINSVHHHGNVSGATVPLALAEAVEQGRIQPGSVVLMTSVGAGYTFGAAIHRF